MIKSAAKRAVWFAVGAAILGCTLPRVLFPETLGSAWPPVWKEALLFFISGFIAAFTVLLAICRIKDARNQDKPSANANRRRAIFESPLPQNVDWQQVSEFLMTTGFYKQLLLDAWRESDAFQAYPVSDATIECLRCLHEDLSGCYAGIFVFDGNGKEDRDEEYRLLRENLFTKYADIGADILERIYLQYLQDDR